jgi:hypothetical protein
MHRLVQWQMDLHYLGACGVFSRSARNVEEMRLRIGIGAISVVVVKAFSV